MFLELLIIILSLCLLVYCMLSSPAKASTVLLPRGAVSPSSRHFLTRSQHLPRSYPTAMFREAVTSHDRQSSTNSSATTQSTLGQFHGSKYSGPLKTIPMASGVNQPLQQVPSSTLNRIDNKSPAANSCVKRTASGLAKAIGANARDSFHDPTPPAALQHSFGNKQETDVAFDENDFDSDLDLDVEDPSTKGSISYPSLPPKQPVKPTVSYPQLQKAPFHTEASRDSGYATTNNDEPPLNAAPPPSSAPIPWSSSPSEHTRTPQKTHGLGRFAYNAESEPRSRTHAGSRAGPTKPSGQDNSRPTKRRTLPWLTQDSNVGNSTQPDPTISQTQSRTVDPHAVTPDARASQYLWNTTASAIKEQQKKLRKESKKIAQDTATNLPTDAGGMQVRKPTVIARPGLSTEQRHVLDLVVEQKKSVFFTGSAGTGKSVLLREIISVLRKKNAKQQDRVAITASTGLAACNVGGVTLHSFAGIGLGKEDAPELVKKIKRNQKAKHRWLRTSVLIVDEISMVDADLFDKLEAVARALRNNSRPFGGIQLVITGDFFQLPPVPESGRQARFCFDASAWASSIDHTIGLHHVFRQKDSAFAGMLNEMREGHLSEKSVRAFHALSRPLDEDSAYPSFAATELFPTRQEVEAANSTRMRQLHGSTVTYEARDGGSIVDKAQRDRLLGNCMAPEVLELKKGAQVMLIKNIDEMLVNGSLGRVRGFMNEAQFDSYNADPDEFERLQQASDDEGLSAAQMKKRRQMHLNAGSTAHVWPLIRFTLSDGNTRDLLCNRETWKIELPNGEVQASRQQVPLILAWALSIHKAQGQTLEKVKVDLGRVFEKGQAYVALSRATTMKGLQVLRFEKGKVMAHERVRGFYRELDRVAGTSEGERKTGWETLVGK